MEERAREREEKREEGGIGGKEKEEGAVYGDNLRVRKRDEGGEKEKR